MRSWFLAKGYKRSERVPARFILAAEQGHAEESITDPLLEKLGHEILERSLSFEHPLFAPRGGTIDRLLLGEKLFVADVKRMGLRYYKDFVERGIKVARPDYYTQIQLYMAAFQARGMIIALSADSSVLPWPLKHWPIWIEEIEPDIEWLESRVVRTEGVLLSLALDEPAASLRDFDPWHDKHPCSTICGFLVPCKEAR